jgi:hypothetical protein
MYWWIIAAGMVSGSALYAQAIMPMGIVRGDVVAWSGSGRTGELEIRSPQRLVYSCLYDARTYFEREHQAIGVTELSAGDPVEVVADRRPGSGACYTRMVQVVEKGVRRVPTARSSIGWPVPRGDIAFGGVVVRSSLLRMTMKTRAGEVSLILRPDTRYVGDGVRVDSTGLVNKHVFVRGGRDIDGHLEAYQIMWSDEMTGN